MTTRITQTVGTLNDLWSSTTYVLDTANRLSSVTVGSETTTYLYNGDGDRISQTVGSTTTTYVLDTATPLTMVLAETNTSTGVTTRRISSMCLVPSGPAAAGLLIIRLCRTMAVWNSSKPPSSLS